MEVYRAVLAYIHPLLISALELSCQLQAPSALPLEKEAPLSNY
jgi:hypothetical protein